MADAQQFDQALGPAFERSRAAAVAYSYREALRAWYITSQATGRSTPSGRLEDRVAALEDAAVSVEMPALWYFLESARLIRAGDLTGAQSAFEAGIAVPAVEATVASTIGDVAGHPAAVDMTRPLSARYREATRARYIADHAGSDPASAARLEERVVALEDAAATLDMPTLRYVLESARLIRAGDLTGAQIAFDSGVASPTMARPVTPVRVAVAVPRAIALDRIVLAAYLMLMTIAELGVTYGSPLLVFPLHGGIVGLAALHVAWLERRPDPEAHYDRLRPFLLTFIVIASIRLISLTLPLAAIEPAYGYLLAGIPMTLGAILVAREARYSMRDVGLVWRKWRMQLTVIAVSMGLGFVEFAILQPDPLGPLPWVAGGVLPAVVVGIATGLPEELIFRGVLQTATRPILGRWNWVYASLVFTVLHIGWANPLDLAFVFGVGLMFGWVFERSRSIIGTSIAHGQANVVLFFIAPHLAAFAGSLGL